MVALQCIQQDESTMRFEKVRYESDIMHDHLTSREHKKNVPLQYKLRQIITSYILESSNFMMRGCFVNNREII